MKRDKQQLFQQLVKSFGEIALSAQLSSSFYEFNQSDPHFSSAQKIIDLFQQISKKKALKQQNRVWIQNELKLFFWTLLKYSEKCVKAVTEFNEQDWLFISDLFEKDVMVCKYYSLMADKHIRTDSFIRQQDLLLFQIKNQQPKAKWGTIARIIFQRSNGRFIKKPKQYRQRWNNYLDPQVCRDKWTREQQIYLMKLVKQLGRKWSLIGKKLKNRTQNSVKNHFNSLFAKHALSKRSKRKLISYSDQELSVLLDQIIVSMDQNGGVSPGECSQKNSMLTFATNKIDIPIITPKVLPSLQVCNEQEQFRKDVMSPTPFSPYSPLIMGSFGSLSMSHFISPTPMTQVYQVWDFLKQPPCEFTQDSKKI